MLKSGSSSVGRVVVSKTKGRGFDPLLPDMKFNILNILETEDDKKFLKENCYHMFQKHNPEDVTPMDIVNRINILRREDEKLFDIINSNKGR